MKKILSVLLLIVLSLFSVAQAEETLNAALIDKARKTAAIMHDMAGMDSYTALYIDSDSVQNIFRTISEADYAQPEAAVVIAVPDALISVLLTLMQIDAPEDSDLFRIMKGRLFNMIPSYLNGSAGDTWLAAASVLGVTDVYLSDVSYGGIAYVLLQYAGEQPDVLCAFSMNGDTAALAGCFVETSALDSADWSSGVSGLLKSLAGIDWPAALIDLSEIALTRYPAEALEAMN